jgi:hypothetical protein
MYESVKLIIKNMNFNNNNNKIKEIINSIKDTDNFRIAFTHKSICSLYPDRESYERLEFFGDSLLEYYTTYFLFKSFPKHSEGNLTKLRTLLVERKNLSKLSLNIGLDKYLKISSALKLEPESDKTIKLLADIFESFIAALYIEKGEDVLHTFLSLTVFNRPETLKYLNDYKLNSLLINDSPINFVSDVSDHKVEQLNILNKLDTYNIDTELRNTNKILCELNNNILNVNKELSDLRLGGLKNINNNNSIILILLLILAIIVIKLIL